MSVLTDTTTRRDEFVSAIPQSYGMGGKNAKNREKKCLHERGGDMGPLARAINSASNISLSWDHPFHPIRALALGNRVQCQLDATVALPHKNSFPSLKSGTYKAPLFIKDFASSGDCLRVKAFYRSSKSFNLTPEICFHHRQIYFSGRCSAAESKNIRPNQIKKEQTIANDISSENKKSEERERDEIFNAGAVDSGAGGPPSPPNPSLSPCAITGNGGSPDLPPANQRECVELFLWGKDALTTGYLSCFEEVLEKIRVKFFVVVCFVSVQEKRWVGLRGDANVTICNIKRSALLLADDFYMELGKGSLRIALKLIVRITVD
ncbi:hypothetical protein CEXT_337121 [Caerostris extrusa]|uniref:Uncharacterized protein n=1 Tax=Caerostris extrusa TaxID=172846 RepID=A0AAV4MRU9_CAEEX|nr:hypothetical protein CEXT_337121 [Caerostris extrusa]